MTRRDVRDQTNEAREVDELALSGIAADDRCQLLELLTSARSNLLDVLDADRSRGRG